MRADDTAVRSVKAAVSAMILVAIGCLPARDAAAAELVLEPKMRHLRNAEPREWTEFPEKAEATDLTYSFEVTDTFRPQTLRLRHRDLRRDWIISLDGQVLIRIPQGDQDATTFWPLPAEKLKPGKHELKIATKDKTPDDVMFGELRLDTRSKAEMLGEATVEVEVTADGSPLLNEGPAPCRITIVDERGSLMTVGIEPEPRLAIRPGVIYTLDGRAKFTVPAGTYVLYASRGFEYSVENTTLRLKVGDVAKPRHHLKHEVDLYPIVSIDPHVHTLTHSGHGDCTLEERIVTIAGEGLGRVTATEHNKIVDYQPAVDRMKAFNVRVGIGCELTTKVGHFNIAGLDPAGPSIDHECRTWSDVTASIRKVKPGGGAILNHARDIHNGFRPFDPSRHISIAGEDAEGWILPADAMEVFNSGSTQNDPTQLFHDWLGLLNRGLNVIPVGSSDSHDVARYIVGQGRTYLADLSEFPVLKQVPVGASMGLLCLAEANGTEFGELVATANEYNIGVRVYGPDWTAVDELRLFVNGTETSIEPVKMSTLSILKGRTVKRYWRWSFLRFKHDVCVVALVKGPGVDAPYWPIAKPYQPTSPDWKSYVIGCSGAIKIDGDGDGKYSSPYDYAKKLFAESAGDDAKLVAALKDYDEAVAVQTASVARAAGRERFDSFLAAVAKSGAPQTKTGANKYVDGWRKTLVPQAAPR